MTLGFKIAASVERLREALRIVSRRHDRPDEERQGLIQGR